MDTDFRIKVDEIKKEGFSATYTIDELRRKLAAKEETIAALLAEIKKSGETEYQLRQKIEQLQTKPKEQIDFTQLPGFKESDLVK